MGFNVRTPDSVIDPSPDWAAGVVVVIVITNVLTVALNGVCIVLSLRDKKLRAQQSIPLTLNLAITDCVLGLLSAPVYITNLVAGGGGGGGAGYVWRGGQSTCAYIGFVAVACCCNSIMSLGIIAVERYLIVVRARHSSSYTQFTRYNTHMIVAGWTLAIIVGALPYAGVGVLDLQQSRMLCVPRWYGREAGEIANSVICFIVLSTPLTVCFWCYYKIFAFVKANAYTTGTVTAGGATTLALAVKPRSAESSQIKIAAAPASTHPAVTIAFAAPSTADATLSSSQPPAPPLPPLPPPPPPPPPVLTISVPLPPTGTSGGGESGGMSGSLMSPLAASAPALFTSAAASASASASAASAAVKRDKKERQIARKMFVLAAAFAICWGPYGVLEVVEIITGSPLPAWYDAFCICFAYTNSFANAVLFLYVNPRMKRVFLDTFWCRSRDRYAVALATGAGAGAVDPNAVVRIEPNTNAATHDHRHSTHTTHHPAVATTAAGGGRTGAHQTEFLPARPATAVATPAGVDR